MSFAKLTAVGNLGGNPETAYTPNGTMNVKFSIAVNDWRNRDAPPTWYRCTAWDSLATRLDSLAAKGSLQKGYTLYVEGNFKPNTFTGKDGAERVSYDVNLTDFEFVGGRTRDDNADPTEPAF